MPQYSLSDFNQNTKFFEISAIFDTDIQSFIKLSIARWRPARYDLQFYVQFVQNIRFFDAADLECKHELPFNKPNLDTWNIEVKDVSQIKVLYRYYANQFEAGGSFIGGDFILLNPINFLIFDTDDLNLECDLEIDLESKSWVLGGNNHRFSENNQNTQILPKLQFASFHDLGDCPLFLVKEDCQQFEMIDFEVPDLVGGKITTQIALYGHHKLDLKKLELDFQAFMTEQVKVFKSFASDKYTFICILPDKAAYHGVEHQHSSVNILGPGFMLSNRDNPLFDASKNHILNNNYSQLLGLSSHEFFHHWNIKSIRPIELNSYDYTRENLFKTGYVAEGFTTLYGDLMLYRAGLISLDTFGKIIGKTATNHLQNFGKNMASMHESSLDLWIDGYKRGIPDDKVNIYVEGSLQAIILDNKLRKDSSNRVSLDVLLLEMYQKFGNQNIGYTEDNLIQICNDLTNQEYTEYFQAYFSQKIDLIRSLSQSLESMGLKLDVIASGQIHEAYFGLKLSVNQGNIEIVKISPISQSYHALKLGDQLFSLNGHILNIENYLGWFDFYVKENLDLVIIRGDKTLQVSLIPSLENGFKEVVVTILDNSLI